MKSQDLGINIDNTLVIKTHATFGPPGSDSLFLRNLSVLKDKLIANSGIEGVTATYDIPGKEHMSLMSNFRHSKNPDEFVSLYFTRMDTEFIPAFNVKMIAGRNFLQGADNQSSMILNHEAIHALGFEDPQKAIGHEVVWGNQHPLKATIVGVVDFRSTSFKNHNYPISFTSTHFPFKYFSVVFEDLNGGNAKQNIALIEKNLKAVFPDIPFEHFFLDDLFNRQYKAEQQFSQLLGIFTMLAIVVACLGLYAISSLTVAQKTKEVGLRKIMGASLNNLLMLLSKKFVALVLVAGLISLPIVYFATTHWMQNYPYRAAITWWIFLIPIALILIITVFTIGYQIVKTALINPSELLRYE
ncbi:MAG: hypothetical protein M3512_17315 [Bacteroidota bacterium]|nr:hypothetical protein [Bacteroidota bacterium]